MRAGEVNSNIQLHIRGFEPSRGEQLYPHFSPALGKEWQAGSRGAARISLVGHGVRNQLPLLCENKTVRILHSRIYNKSSGGGVGVGGHSYLRSNPR